MIIGEAEFRKRIQSGAQVACLPQDDGGWCLAVKSGPLTSYLGRSERHEVIFPTLDEAVTQATGFEIGQIIVITGAKAWEF
jgi:hypothetical protein